MYENVLGSPALCGCEEKVNQRGKLIWGERLDPKGHVKGGVILLSVSVTAQNQYREKISGIAQAADKFDPVHPRHQMVSQHQANQRALLGIHEFQGCPPVSRNRD